MGLLNFQRLGRVGDTPRLWIESQRLDTLGFSHGIPLRIEMSRDSLVLRPTLLAQNHVSSRTTPLGRRPIIDLASASLLADLAQFSEVKVIASFERIEVSPSRRAFAILRSQRLEPPFHVLEIFAGGGTMTQALAEIATFAVRAGVEIEPDYADEWQLQNPKALLIQSDVFAIHGSELPEFDVLVAGIPCTSHSPLGRAKKHLAGRPELGDTGGLFLPVLQVVAERIPAVIVLENVPSFATSLAGQLIVSNLRRLGYHVMTTILRPNEEWGEIEDRKRWVLIATLARPFVLRIPLQSCTQRLSEFLDPPNESLDAADARRISRTVEGLKVHAERHRELGHGFGFTVVRGSDTRLPTIPKSYHKINTGPFVHTAFGPRLLRLSEIERIHGCELRTKQYSTAVQIVGQGVQTRVFRNIFAQISDHLIRNAD